MRIILIVFVIIFLLVPVYCDAQETKAKPGYKTRYGLKAGLTNSNLHGDTQNIFMEPASKSSFAFGGFALMRINNLLYIQTEILLIKKGARAADPDLKDRLNLNHLEFPVLAKLYIFPKASVKPHLFFGSAPSILLSAEYDYGGLDVDIKDVITKFDFGLVAGGGIDITAGKGIFMIDARFTHGVISIDDSGDDLNIKNNVLLFTIGYAF